MEIPCLRDLDSNCPPDCPLYTLALKRILHITERLTMKERKIVSMEEAIAELRKMSPDQKKLYDAKNVQLLQKNKRLDECSNTSSAPLSPSRDQ